MKMRTFIGLCAALAFAAGSTAVHAVKIVADAGDDPTAEAAMASVTYAAETLLMGDDNMTAASDEDDETAYYNIGGDDLFISAPADIAATLGDIYVVAFTLEGMVFQEQVTSDQLTGGSFSLATGGGPGDKIAVFRLSGGAVATVANITMEANFAISAAGSGTIARTVTNQTLAGLDIPGVDGSMTHTGTGIIKVAAALDEKAVAMNPTAEVADGFKMFLNGRTTASVGTLFVGVKEMHRRANATGAADDVDMLDHIILTGDDDSTPAKPNSTVRFMGDFSFASKVFTHGDADCGAGANDAHVADPNSDTETAANADGLLMRDDDDMVSDTAMTMAVDVADNDDGFGTPRHLCIMVQGEDTDEMNCSADFGDGRIHGDGVVQGNRGRGDRPEARGTDSGHDRP